MPIKIDAIFRNEETLRCQGAEKTDKEFQSGEFFGTIVVNGTVWAVVLWDGEDDPDLYKANLLLIEYKMWRRYRLDKE